MLKASPFSPVDYEYAGQIQPYLIFQRRHLTALRDVFSFKVDYGYGYLLRWLITRWPTADAAVVTALAPPLYFEVSSAGASKRRQLQPITLNLNTTPAGHALPIGPLTPAYAAAPGVTYDVAAPSPAAPDNLFSRNFSSALPSSHKILNYLFPYGSTILIETTGQNGTIPAYVDLCLFGYYVPEKALRMWGGTRG